jgi:uncharacterized protein DUF3471
MTERHRRRDFGHIDLEITYDDPKAYTRPFTVRQTLQFQPDNELLETVCHENERDRAHLVGRTRPPLKVAPEILARYAGRYQVAPGRLIVITVVDDQLWVEQGESGPVPLNADSNTTFILELAALGPPSRFDFFSNARGQITHLTWQRPAGEVKAVRIGAAPALAAPQGRWVPRRTPWGDPDLQGVFTNEDQQRVPMERPDRFAGRTLNSITTRPWTFSMPLIQVDESRGPLENACHEGNYVLRNILSAARAEEQAAEDAARANPE